MDVCSRGRIGGEEEMRGLGGGGGRAYLAVRSISMEKMQPGCHSSAPSVSVALPSLLIAKAERCLKAVTPADLATTFHPLMLNSRKALESAHSPSKAQATL